MQLTNRQKLEGKGSILFFLLILSAYGPYLYPNIGFRLDHLVIYSLVIFCLPNKLLQRNNFKPSLTVMLVITCLSMVIIWTTTVTLLTNRGLSIVKIIASFENYLQPLALILVILIASSKSQNQYLSLQIEGTCFILCLFLCVNTLVAITGIFFDTWPLLRYFQQNIITSTGLTVWQNAVSMGRYPGVFNQPFEAGVAYSIGLAAWVYWTKTAVRKESLKILLLSLIFFGGMISISKAFLFVGVPLFFFYSIWPFKNFLKNLKTFFVFAATFFVTIYFTFSFNLWKGEDYFLRFFTLANVQNKDILSLYTSGRFSNTSTDMKQLFYKTWNESPIQGFGFGLESAIDNSYLEFFYQGGVVGLILYFLILLIILSHVIKHYKKSVNECQLLAVLLIIIVFAGFGAPILTLNRSSIFLWILIILSVEASRNKFFQHHF